MSSVEEPPAGLVPEGVGANPEPPGPAGFGGQSAAGEQPIGLPALRSAITGESVPGTGDDEPVSTQAAWALANPSLGPVPARQLLAEEPMLTHFGYDHLPTALQRVSREFGLLAEWIVLQLPRCPERTVALRKLLEAKDCAVRSVPRGAYRGLEF